jgi:anti-sigma B factor antagonist
MKLHESRDRNAAIFHLEDEIDLHYAATLRALFQAKADRRCPALVVDLSGVPFIDSTGIAVFLEYLRDATEFGGRFCLAAPTDHLRRVFEITRLNDALPIFENVAEAVAAVANNTLPSPARPLFDRERKPEPLISIRAA